MVYTHTHTRPHKCLYTNEHSNIIRISKHWGSSNVHEKRSKCTYSREEQTVYTYKWVILEGLCQIKALTKTTYSHSMYIKMFKKALETGLRKVCTVDGKIEWLLLKMVSFQAVWDMLLYLV